MKNALIEIEKKCKHCKKCALSKTSNNVVFSRGIANPKLMLIGEAPGFYEDQKGIPFVGKAGQLLEKIFASVGLSLDKDVYICNTIKCHPPNNRNPFDDEKASCREYLDAQLDIIQPRIILLCGGVAVKSMFGEVGGITRVRGKWFDGPNGAKMMPIFHPSYLLRNDSREKGSPKWLMWQDIQAIRKAYDLL